jgi:transcriptional regulator with XRE-family HTH domain
MTSFSTEEQLYAELGVRVRAEREARRWTQEALAALVGVSRSSIANVERGQQYAPLHVVLQLAKVFSVPLDALVPTPAEVLARTGATQASSGAVVNIGGQHQDLPPDLARLVGTLFAPPERRPPQDPRT